MVPNRKYLSHWREDIFQRFSATPKCQQTVSLIFLIDRNFRFHWGFHRIFWRRDLSRNHFFCYQTSRSLLSQFTERVFSSIIDEKDLNIVLRESFMSIEIIEFPQFIFKNQKDQQILHGDHILCCSMDDSNHVWTLAEIIEVFTFYFVISIVIERFLENKTHQNSLKHFDTRNLLNTRPIILLSLNLTDNYSNNLKANVSNRKIESERYFLSCWAVEIRFHWKKLFKRFFSEKPSIDIARR